MPNFTIEDLPDKLYAELCRRAQMHQRSVSDEVKRILELELAGRGDSPSDAATLRGPKDDAWDPIAEAEALDRQLGRTFDEKLIEEGKREGRA